jgi:hypothetical protein
MSQLITETVLSIGCTMAALLRIRDPGLGSMLVKKCEKLSQEWGFNRLMLQVIPVSFFSCVASQWDALCLGVF